MKDWAEAESGDELYNVDSNACVSFTFLNFYPFFFFPILNKTA